MKYLKNDYIYKKYAGPKYSVINKWIGNGKKVLDVGCGSGKFSQYLALNGNQVTGIEISEKNYEIAKNNISVYLGDFLKIDISEKFDIVLFGDVLEHMKKPDEAIRKAARICDEIIICVPNFNFWGVKILKTFGIKKMNSGILDKNHIFFFNKVIIENMILNNGLKITDYSSPAPKKIPSIYNYFIPLNPNVFGYQFIYKCRVK